MNKEENSRIYSERIRAGKRTYFLDIKKNREDRKYLLITESKKRMPDEYIRQTIMVQEEDIDKIKEGLGRAFEAFPNL